MKIQIEAFWFGDLSPNAQQKAIADHLAFLNSDPRDTFEYTDPEIAINDIILNGYVFDSMGTIMSVPVHTTETAGDVFEVDTESPQFPNGFDSWRETHFEVVAQIALAREQDEDGLVKQAEDSQGTGGLYELAKSLTDEFEKLHAGKEWDGEFFDAIEDFLYNKHL